MTGINKQLTTHNMEIKVKEVKGMLSDEGVPYYRERYGKPLLIKLWDGWNVCSKDGEPSHLIDPNIKITITSPCTNN